jgi:hypothetical protein
MQAPIAHASEQMSQLTVNGNKQLPINLLAHPVEMANLPKSQARTGKSK